MKTIYELNMLDIIDELAKKYYELGYEIKEICMPKEFKKEIDANCVLLVNKSVDILQGDYANIKLFENQSKHFNIIITPIKKKKK